MKKIFMGAAVAALVCLTACAGKSEASREQIANGHEQAKEMLRKADTPQAAPGSTQASAATPAPSSTPASSAAAASSPTQGSAAVATPASVSAPQTPADSVR